MPPPVATTGAAAAAEEQEVAGHAVLGPVVLLVGALGMATGWLLPFYSGTGSLYDRSFGDPAGYGISFWTAYDDFSGLGPRRPTSASPPDPAAGRPAGRPGCKGIVKLRLGCCRSSAWYALVWAIGLLILFVLVEVPGSSAGTMRCWPV